MKKNKTPIFLTVLLACCMLAPSLGLPWNHPGASQDRDEIFLPHDSTIFAPRIILEIQKELELSPRQISQIEQLVQLFEESQIRSLAELKIRELRLGAIVRNRETSRKLVRREVAEIGKIHSERLYRFLDTILQIRHILNPRQLGILNSVRHRNSVTINPR